MPSCAALASSALRRRFIEVGSWRCRTQRTPAGEIDRPRRFSASDTCTWPQAGCPIAISTTACPIAGAVRFFRIGLPRLISRRPSSPPLSYSSVEPVEAVAAVAHHLAGLAHVAELLGSFHDPNLRSDDLPVLRHGVISVSPQGGARSRLG
jgi:hypothetical protein